jgi:germination protein M
MRSSLTHYYYYYLMEVLLMERLRKVPIYILVLLLGILLSGCNNQIVEPDSSDQTDSEQTMEVAVYYLKSGDDDIYLVREVHQVEKTSEVAQAALNELIKGEPLTPDAFRVLPEDTRILGINIDNGLATVDFSSEVLRANVGSSGEGLGIASIVNTLTEFPTIQEVSFMVDGQVENAMDWWGHVGLYEQPFQRDLSNVFEPAIWVTSPVKDQVITSPVTIRGNARVFEATVSFRLKDAAGNVLAEGFTTAAEGAPGRGDFEGELAFKPEGSGQGQLEVFEVSMKDGSDRNKVIIPVEW